MPPVRWKYMYVILTLGLVLTVADAQLNQDAITISMSSDGWRPIVGTRRHPPGFSSVDIKAQEITEYKDPSQTVEVDVVKAETVEPSSTVTSQKTSTKINLPDSNNNINGGTVYKKGEKIPPHTKFTSPGPYHTLPASVHGPPIPISGTHNKPIQFGQIKKRPSNKPSTPSFLGPKRKPVRGPMVSHSNRNEVFVRPPASFPFIKQAPSNVKTRETQGLGLLSSNHFLVNQPGSHIDFTNRFAVPPSEENFQHAKNHPVTFIFSKPANELHYQFKNQNDEYTRNLVPPPPLAVFQQDTDKLKPIKFNPNVNENVVTASTEPIIKLSDFTSNIQFGMKPSVQDNLVPQLPPPFEQNFAFQKQITKPKEQAVDVQVTKENLKVFHSNQPVNYNTNDYVDYDFHSLKKPMQLPKIQTYEVTEGRWVDSPNPYTFSITKAQPLIAQPLRQLPTGRPHLVTEPIVELNVPPFLPTPYRPDSAVPTSPTQSEVSTIFSQVSTKMNRYKNEALSTNPFFFDVKEVSTHYPILGRPEPKPESPTGNPMDVNSEISNEITTVIPTTSRLPQTNKSRRRKPRPRRPSSTTTTTTSTSTTTEEPLATESYELQKTEENFEEMPEVETERPQRRRPRPNRVRTSSSEERPVRYRTTTPPNEGEDISEKRVRTRHRTRQRGSGIKSENRNIAIRKRIRPINTDMPPNHKMTENDVSHQPSEATEPYIEQVESIERETQGLFETKYPRENAQSSDTKNNRIEYELPNRHFEPTQDEEESKYETTIVSNDLSSIGKPVFEENDEEETERMQVYERTRPSVSDTTMEETTANIHLPENEVDYSTPIPSTEQIDERIQTTIATTIPTTTTAETTTTKSHRIRGRPLKNRPKFSVKDYRQRLNQYTSTTPSTTTDIMKTTSEGSLRLRFPSRLRTRPTSKTTTTTTEGYNPDEEEDMTEPIRRGGFRPKEPRHGSITTENTQDNIITEKYVKSVNTRLRPFGRHRSTTESPAVSQKVSIKPNLFSIRRRPPQLSLRNRIFNRINNTAEETTTNESEMESTEPITIQTTETDIDNVPTESNTVKMKAETTTEINESTTVDVNEDDYIQRVSDLTSSFKNEYETPGLFKSVSPNSRRIPNYFTISTDDPILPIEAFFPNIKDKEQK